MDTFPRFATSTTLLALLSAPLLADTPALPDGYDLRNIDGRSYIGPVRDQGDAGTCYAFATCAVAEAAYNRYMGLYDDDTVDFSEAFIAYSMDPFYDSISGVMGGDSEGGYFQALVDYGVCSEADFPYTITDPGEGNHHLDAERVQFSSWHFLPSYDVETMKRAMQQFGAITTGLNVDDAFYDYEDGVFSNTDTAADNIDLHELDMNHLVGVVGWQDSDEAPSGGYWIVRNSWSSDWGEDGYARLDYFSNKAAVIGNYVVYGGWQGENTSFTLQSDIDSGSVYDASQTGHSAYGVYEWGGDGSLLTSEGSVNVEHVSSSGYGLTHGLFLWAGEHARMINFGDVLSSITTTDGVATAYGLCLQGMELANAQESTVVAIADGDGTNRATAYGAAFFAFDITNNKGAFLNIGDIYAKGAGANSWAYGVHVMNGEYLLNDGNIYVEAEDMAAGIYAYNVTLVENNGLVSVNSKNLESYGVYQLGGTLNNAGSLSVETDNGRGYGVFMEDGTIENTGAIETRSNGEDARSYGVHATNSSIINSGYISCISDLGTSIGICMNGGSFVNTSDGTVGPFTNDGTSVGVDITNATILNNGRIRGDENYIASSTISGSGYFYGVMNLENCIVNPGNSVGEIGFGGIASSGALTINMEIVDGEGDQIYVRHNASVEGENNVLNVIHSGYLPEDDYVFIFAEEDATGAFQTVNTAAMFDGSVFIGENGFTLDLDRKSYADFADHSEYEAMGIALDSARPLATGDFADMLNIIDSYANAEAISASVSSLFPAVNSDASALALDTVQRGNAFVARHWKGKAAGSAADSRRYTTWFSLMNGDIDFDSNGAFGELRGDSSGFAAGAEYRAGKNWTFGVSAVQGKDKLRYADSGDKGRLRAEQVFLHAMWDRKPGANGPYAGLSLGIGTLDIHTERAVDFLSSNLRGDHDADAQSLWLGGGWDLNNKIWTTRPFVDLQYSRIKEDSYAELGDDGAALLFGQRTGESLLAGFGMSVSANFRYGRTVIIPELRILREEELMGNPDAVMARFSAGPMFNVKQRDLSGSRTTMGAALRAVVDERVTAAVDFERREFDDDDMVTDSVSAHLQFRF